MRRINSPRGQARGGRENREGKRQDRLGDGGVVGGDVGPLALGTMECLLGRCRRNLFSYFYHPAASSQINPSLFQFNHIIDSRGITEPDRGYMHPMANGSVLE